MKKRKKIVHLNYSFTIGGIENLLVDLINQQVQHFSVYLIIINKYYSEGLLQQLSPDVKVICINRTSGSRNYLKIVRLNLLLAIISPHVIHCHNPNILKVLFSQRHKTILTVHDVNIEMEDLHKYGRLVAISQAVKDDIKVGNKQCDDVEVVYNGIDFSKIPVKNDSTTGHCIKILQVSRLVHEKKGQDVLLKAVDRLVNTLGKTIELHLVGSGKSKPYLEQLIQQYGLQNLVFLYDDKDRSWIYPNLKNFDILIQPSRYEGFGLTIVEGMAAGLPVIASNLDGPKEILCNGRYGYLFESEDYVGLADKIEEVIDQYNSGTIEPQIARAYQHGVKHFSLPNMVNNYGEIYQQMTSWHTERKIALL